VKSIVDESNLNQKTKIVESLSALLNLESRNLLKQVYLIINDQKIDSDKISLELKANELNELKIAISNIESSTAKNVEVGLVFPKDFIIEKRNSYSNYTDEKSQIVRFQQALIHGNTNVNFFDPVQKLGVTPLNEGKYVIKVFVKGENIDTKYRNLTLNIKNQ
jgi:hypothetical protein